MNYPRRVLTRAVAFVGAALCTGLLLALQAGVLRGAFAAATYLAVTFAPVAVIDALLVPRPRTGPTRLARIGLLFALLLGVGALWQWRALAVVPADLQLQIAFEVLLRDIAFLGVYLLLEAVFGSLLVTRAPA